MTTTWLVFLNTLATGEEFVLPVQAPSREAALKAARSAYSPRAYAPLTCYGEVELQRILSDAQLWSVGTPLESVAAAEVQIVKAPRVEETVVQQAERKATEVMLRLQRKQNEQLREPSVAASPAAAVVTAPAQPAVTETLAQVTSPVVTGAAAPLPQDLKTMLAMLRATAAGSTASAALLGGRVEMSQGAAAVAAIPLGTVFESRPVASPPAISRRPPAEQAAGQVTGSRSMFEVLKELRK